MVLYEDRSCPGRFIELALFDDVAAWERSEARVQTDPAMGSMLARWRGHLAEDPKVAQLVPVPIRPPEVHIRPATESDIHGVWTTRWGSPVFSHSGLHHPPDMQGLVASVAGELAGLVTWRLDGEQAEIISLDAFPAGYGIGGALLRAAEEALAALGATQGVLGTTNDNLGAVGFYQKHGWRVTEVRLDAVDRSLKPTIPEIGHGGLPMQDVWILEKTL
jgi:GNAT superfamily N-acetyltransferase